MPESEISNVDITICYNKCVNCAKRTGARTWLHITISHQTNKCDAKNRSRWSTTFIGDYAIRKAVRTVTHSSRILDGGLRFRYLKGNNVRKNVSIVMEINS